MSTFTEANRKAFNDLSETYNSKPWQRELSSQVSDALQERKDWLGVQWATPDDGKDVRLLDYACGTGSITKALGQYVTTIQGIDISEKMVERYNEAALSSGLRPENTNAVVGDLFGEKVPEHLAGPRFQSFDIAVIGLGFHHFEDPALSTARLVERLKPDGVLVIVDFLPFDKDHQQSIDSNAHGRSHTIKHSGFARSEMEALFTKAGLEDFSWAVLDEPAVMEFDKGTVHRTLFIARGRRPAVMSAADSDVEKARELKKHIDRIRADYSRELKSELMAERQRATAVYLIDQYTLGAGNEEDEDEADIVCSLKFQDVTLRLPQTVIFDFPGKDPSEVQVDAQIFKNLMIFKRQPKKEGDDIFDRLTTSSLNEHLSSYMQGLTAKIFRIYNAS